MYLTNKKMRDNICAVNRTEAKKMKNKIKYYRELKNLSQEELAKLSNVSRVTISGLENETIKVTTNTTMDKISKALGVSTIELFYT